MLRAVQNFVLILLATLCSGCSDLLLDTGPAAPFDISRIDEADKPPLFKSIGKDGDLSLFEWLGESTRPPGASRLYASAVRSCSVEKGEKLPSVARKVFVGLTQLRIASRQELSLGETPLFTMTFTARFEETPLAFASVTMVRDECATDIALWTPLIDATSQEASLARMQQALNTLVERLAGDNGKTLEDLIP